MKQPYYVVSPEYATGGYYEPPEYGCDCVEVEAETKREAVILGVRKILKDDPDKSWAGVNRQSEQSPFAGYRAELARCGHGHPHFILVNEKPVHLKCWACEAESERFAAEEPERLNS